MNDVIIENAKRKVLVLVSTYNGEKNLCAQLNSILQQQGDFDLEILVRDDGSQDRTTQILSEYQNNDRLTWYKDGENVGAANSFMRLLYDAPEADYYAFSDQDDVWKENKIDESIKYLSEINGYGVVYTNAYLVDSNLNSLNCKVFTDIQKMTVLKSLCSCNAMGCTMVMNNSLVQLIKNMPIPNNIIMHDGFICGVCMSCGGEVIYLEEPTMYYRQHSNNAVGYTTDRFIFNRIREKYNHITQKRKIQINRQAEEIYKYKNFINERNLHIVEMVMNYKENIGYRLHLVIDLICLGISKNGTKHEILNALAVLLGNA